MMTGPTTPIIEDMRLIFGAGRGEEVDVSSVEITRLLPLAGGNPGWEPQLATSNTSLIGITVDMTMGHSTNLEPESVLSRAAFRGDLEQLSMLLDNGENYRSWDKSGWTSLHWAVVGGHLHIIQKLLEYHSDSEQPDPELYRMPSEEVKSYIDGPPPIILAAEGRNIATSSDVEIFWELALRLEIPDRRLRVAKFNVLWDQGKFDIGRSRFSANLWRVMGKEQHHHGLESGILTPYGRGSNDLNSHRTNESDWKSTLLMYAIRDNQWSVMQMLIKAGADVNLDYALHVAAFRSDPRYVECLIQHDANVNYATLAGRTALHEAVMNGFLDTITALVNGGADVNLQQAKEYGESSQHLDCRLLTEGFDFRLTRKGASPLMQACGFLLGRSAKFRQVYPEDTSQLPEDKTLAIVRFLLSKGADPMLTDSLGMTVLHYAVLQPHVSLIKLLVQSGASVEALDHGGQTPLHYFARCDDNVNIQDLEQVACLLCRKDTTDLSPSLLNLSVSRPPHSSEDQDSSIRSRTTMRIIRKNSRGSWTLEDDDSRTPLAIALLGNRWKLVGVFMRLGATFPTNIDLQVVFDNALKDLEPNVLDLLLQNGVEPPPFAVVTLIRAYTEHTTKRNPANDLYARFKSILTTIIHAGVEVNFCETNEIPNREHGVSESGEEDSASDEEDIERIAEKTKTKCVKDGPKITTPLNLVASIGGLRNILEELLSFGADVYAVSSDAFDPILTAALYGESQDLQCLLDKALSDPCQSHWSSFLADIPEENGAIVRVCYGLKKADVLNRTNYQGRTLLHLAAEQGNNELLTTLISNGARIDILDNQGTSAIHCAAIAGHANAFEALYKSANEAESYKSQRGEEFGKLRNKSDLTLLNSHQGLHVISSVLRIAPNYIFDRYLGLNNSRSPGTSMVYEAAKLGNSEMLSFLLSQKADIEAADNFGWRPLHIACYWGRIKTVQDLIAHGANVHCVTQEWNDNFDKPSGLYLTDSWTGTPLHLASMGGHVDIVQILLDLGVDVHASTKTGKKIFFCTPGHGPTALHLALDTDKYYARQGDVLSEERLRIAQLLVNAGAMVQGVVSKMTAEERLRFHNFPILWEALVAEDTTPDEGDVQVKV